MRDKRGLEPSTEHEEEPRAKKGRSAEIDENENEVNHVNGRSSSPVEETESIIGVIEKVSLKNFMCHESLEINFFPNMNFIIGANSSGKSAVLAALVVGLGGRASATNRWSNLRGFIKHGKNVAEVGIQLKNQGKDAYRVEEYGSSILVERRFTRDGGTNYKIKDSKGRIVSRSHQELERILDHFSIQVENPVSVLNQETSKNFLFSRNPADKYKFFMKATLLETLRSDYARANECRSTAEEILGQRQQSLPGIRKEVKKWEQKFKSLESLEKLRERVVELKNEMAWAFVSESEKEHMEAQKELEKLRSRTPKYTEKVLQSMQTLNALKVEQVAVQENIMKFVEEGKELEPQQAAAKKNYEAKKKALRNAVMEQKKVEKEMKRNREDVSAIEERITEIKSSTQKNHAEERKAREAKIAELRGKMEDLEERKLAVRDEMEQVISEVAQTKEEQRQCRIEDNEYSRLINWKTNELNRKVSSKTNLMDKFGDYMTRLLQQINNAHKKGHFHEKPKGPIGALLKVKEPEWALGVECCLRSYMTSFCVHDHHDERVLEGILKKVCPANKRPSTITSKFSTKEYDVSRGKAQSKYPTVLDMLEIEDPTIKNCVIDQRGVESVLLIRDTEEARRVMANSPPKNAREAFVLSGDQMYSSPTFRYYSSSQDKARYLSKDIDEDIRILGQEIEKLGQEKQAVRQRQQTNERLIADRQRDLQQLQNQLAKLIEKTSQLELEASDLRNQEEPTSVDIATLEEEVQRYNEIIERLQTKYDEVLENSARSTSEFEKAEKDFNEMESRLKVITESVDPFKEQLAGLEARVSSAKDNFEHYEEKEREHVANITKAEKLVKVTQKRVEGDTAKASEICPRVDVDRTPKNIQTEITQIELRIQTEDEERGDPEEITRKYHESMTHFKSIKVEMAHQITFLEEFNKCMIRRRKQFEFFRSSIAMRSRMAFSNMLQARSYEGKLEYNHRAQTLNLKVRPFQGEGEGVDDVRSLSGGERSFSTVCLILALWDVMAAPFHCMDEFDVYMDMINRRSAMEMIVSATRKQRGQYIFLTPLNISFLDATSVHIFRMPAPQRCNMLQNGESNLPEPNEDEDHETRPTKRRR